jgi:hypothetical protein
MRFDDAVRARGFRRWYERQLYESHAWLVTGLLSLVMMAIVIEESTFRGSLQGLALLAAIAVAGGGLALYAWREFNRLLFRAEAMASQANCPGCNAYAKFAVVSSRPSASSIVGCALDVRCRKCAREWTIA